MKHLPLLLLLGGLLSASAARSADPVRYVDAATLTVIGKALSTEQPYNRIDTTRFRVPAKTPGYCYHPTGLAVVFRTDSRTIRARWETSGKNPSDNMAAVAQKGLDLYIRSNGEWVFAGVGRPKINGKNDRHDAAIISNMAEGEKECLLYLPLYDQLKKLEIGVDEKSVIAPMENPFRHKIVVHGSSITHGIAAGRAGMAYSSRLGRDFTASIWVSADSAPCSPNSHRICPASKPTPSSSTVSRIPAPRSSTNVSTLSSIPFAARIPPRR